MRVRGRVCCPAMRGVVRACGFALATLIGFSAPAWSCAGATPGPTKYPLCSLPPAAARETVVAIRDAGDSAVRSNLVLGGFATELARVIDVDVSDGDKSYYVVVSSFGPVIWRFKGKVEQVSRVIVLGSERLGHGAAGVTGISKDRLVFAKPVEKAHVTDRSVLMACGFEAKACHPNHYNYRHPVPGDENRAATRLSQSWDVVDAPDGDLSPAAAEAVPPADLEEVKLVTIEKKDSGAVGVRLPDLSIVKTEPPKSGFVQIMPGELAVPD